MARLNEAGATIVENLIAFTVLATSMVAIFPVFTAAKSKMKYSSARQLCENTIRTKLDEYRFGKMVDLDNYSSYANLTLPTMGGASTGGYQASGFFYSKLRYNELYDKGACNGTSTADILSSWSASQKTFGVRECIGSSSAWNESSTSVSCSTDRDIAVKTQVPNFKLYVKLQLQTTWQHDDMDHANGRDYSATCPNDGDWRALAAQSIVYDFAGVDEGIRITVTGVMDEDDAGWSLRDPSSMMCSATAVVYPYRYPVRYFLGQGGRIYDVQGETGVNGKTTAWPFATIGTQNGTNDVNSAIRAIAVHPRNFSIYVLRAGGLTRYGNCGGVPTDCQLSGDADDGISDFGESTRPAVQEWTVSPQITAIGMNFRNGKMYGFGSGKAYVLQQEIDSAPADIGLCETADCGAIDLTEVDSTQFPMVNFVLGSSATSFDPARYGTFFISPEGDEMFFSDGSSNSSIDTAISIYRSTDTTFSYPIMSFPYGAVSFSK